MSMELSRGERLRLFSEATAASVGSGAAFFKSDLVPAFGSAASAVAAIAQSATGVSYQMDVPMATLLDSIKQKDPDAHAALTFALEYNG